MDCSSADKNNGLATLNIDSAAINQGLVYGREGAANGRPTGYEIGPLPTNNSNARVCL